MSSEYIPTIDKVRDYYCHVAQMFQDSLGDHRFHAEFDRWLAQVERAAAEKAYEQGRVDERHDCTLTTAHLELPPEKRNQEELRKNLRSNNPYRDFEQRGGGDTK